jgi:hypothetical protein
MGNWAKNPREIVTVVDKLKKISKPLSEEQLRPEQQIDLDEIEETLEDYGEYMKEHFPEPEERGIPIYAPRSTPTIVDVMAPESEGQETTWGGFTGEKSPSPVDIFMGQESGDPPQDPPHTDSDRRGFRRKRGE